MFRYPVFQERRFPENYEMRFSLIQFLKMSQVGSVNSGFGKFPPKIPNFSIHFPLCQKNLIRVHVQKYLGLRRIDLFLLQVISMLGSGLVRAHLYAWHPIPFFTKVLILAITLWNMINRHLKSEVRRVIVYSDNRIRLIYTLCLACIECLRLSLF